MNHNRQTYPPVLHAEYAIYYFIHLYLLIANFLNYFHFAKIEIRETFIKNNINKVLSFRLCL